MPDLRSATRPGGALDLLLDGASGTGAIREPTLSGDDVSAGRPTAIELSVHEDLKAVEPQWRALEKRADYTAFQAFDWLAAWQRHLGTRRAIMPAIVLGRGPSGTPLFILPLAVGRRGPLRCLTWLSADLSDYNAPILAEDFSRHIAPSQFAPLWRETIRLIRSSPRLHFDLVDLRKMPETVVRQRNPFLDLAVTPNASGAHMAALAGDWASFYARRSSATRRRDRTKLRRLAGYGEIRFVEPTTSEDVERTLHELFEQKTRSLAHMGVADMFARPGCREFFLDIATRPELRDLVHVSRLEVGSTIAAANLGLRLHGCYYHLLSSYQDGELGRFGPGAAHLRELLRCAVERGFHRFDFTIGDEAYKREWCDGGLKLYDHFAAVSFKASPVAALLIAFFRLKRLIKQNPVLWRAFSMARSITGILKSKSESRSKPRPLAPSEAPKRDQ